MAQAKACTKSVVRHLGHLAFPSCFAQCLRKFHTSLLLPTLSGVLQVFSGVFRCFQVFSGVLQVLSKLVFFGEFDFRCAYTV